MKSSDIPQKVMKRVVDLEARRVFLSWLLMGIVCIAFVVFIAVVATETYREIATRQIADFFAVFEEDTEIVAEFLSDTAFTFWVELPKGIIVLGAILLASFGIFVYSTKHARRILARKYKQLSMMGLKNGGNIWKLGAIFIAVVILVYGAIAVRTRQDNPPGVSDENPAQSTLGPDVAIPPSELEAVIAEITLVINTPKDQANVAQSSIPVSGTTKPNAEVFVNEQETRADSRGNFSLRIQLEEGENYVIVVATDVDGQVAEQALTITYEPAE